MLTTPQLVELDDTFNRTYQDMYGISLHTDVSAKKTTIFKIWEKVHQHCVDLKMPPYVYFQILFDWTLETGKELTREWLNWIGSETAKNIVANNRDLILKKHPYGGQTSNKIADKIVADIRTTKRQIDEQNYFGEYDYKKSQLHRLSPFYLAVDDDWSTLGHYADDNIVQEVIKAQRILKGSGLVLIAKEAYRE